LSPADVLKEDSDDLTGPQPTAVQNSGYLFDRRKV